MDEIEAALDERNVVRYARYMRRIAGKTQFIVITHRRGTMEEADVLYSVTMQEAGAFQKVLTINLNAGEGTETELSGACQHLAAGIIFMMKEKAIKRRGPAWAFDKLKKRSAAASSWTRIFFEAMETR